MTIAGRKVVTNRDTAYKKKFECADLRNGLSVKVKGPQRSDGTVIAQTIERD
jgi:hypothetical protein